MTAFSLILITFGGAHPSFRGPTFKNLIIRNLINILSKVFKSQLFTFLQSHSSSNFFLFIMAKRISLRREKGHRKPSQNNSLPGKSREEKQISRSNITKDLLSQEDKITKSLNIHYKIMIFSDALLAVFFINRCKSRLFTGGFTINRC